MDSNCCVTLFKKDVQTDLWSFCNKKRSHEIEITSIAFGEYLDENEEMKLRLFSVGKDRRLIEYDVYTPPLSKLGPDILGVFSIEKEARPTACILYPKVDTKEELLLTANDEYKMKLWNPS